jgi:hypothetical protein
MVVMGRLSRRSLRYVKVPMRCIVYQKEKGDLAAASLFRR